MEILILQQAETMHEWQTNCNETKHELLTCQEKLKEMELNELARSGLENDVQQGLSRQDVGIHRSINKKHFVSWQDFPRVEIRGAFQKASSLNAFSASARARSR